MKTELKPGIAISNYDSLLAPFFETEFHVNAVGATTSRLPGRLVIGFENEAGMVYRTMILKGDNEIRGFFTVLDQLGFHAKHHGNGHKIQGCNFVFHRNGVAQKAAH